jgi:hypothetical protein
MRRSPLVPLAAPLLLVVAAACGKGEDAPPPSPGGSATAPAVSAYSLPDDPGAAVPVAEAKADAPKDDVVVVGRVREMLKGRAGFQMIDASIPYCGQEEMEGCETPWDYCCKDPKQVRDNTILVRVRDASGRTVAVDRIPELRNLDLVAVRGRLVKDGSDVELHATGWFRRERPDLDWKIAWPE